MRKMWRKLSFVSLAVGLSVLTACGGGGSTNTAAPSSNSGGNASQASKDQKVELRWAMWTGSPEEKQIWEDLAKKVTEKYPNITVKFETDSFSGYWDKLQTQLASKTAPDIISMQSMRNATFSSRGTFEPLDSYIKNTPDFKIDDFAKSALDGLSWDGKQMAIPYDFGPYILYYNKDIFDKNHVEYPKEGMTWDQFLEKAKATTNTKDGTYGFVFRNIVDQLVPWIWSNGGDYMNADATKSTIQDPAATEAIQFVGDLVNKHKVAVPLSDPGNDNWYREQFYSGHAAMILDGPWNFVNVRSKAKFGWDVTTVPTGKAGAITDVAGSGFGIFSGSKHKDEAWKAISVILSQEGENYLASTGRAFPARKSALEPFQKASDKPANLKAVDDAGKSARPYRVTTNWQETQLMINRQLDQIWINNAPAADVTKAIAPQFDALLKQHQQNIGK